VTEAKRSVRLDPFSGPHNLQLGLMLVLAGRADEAVEYGRSLLDSNARVAHRVLGLAYEQKGNSDLAIAEFQQRLNSLGQDHPLFTEATAELAHAYGIFGRRREARQLLSELTEMSKRRLVTPSSFALVYAGLGEKDRTFEWLEKDRYIEGAGMLLKTDPRLAFLRSDPRYRELLRRMGIPPA
jgi:adenylate cyclase